MARLVPSCFVLTSLRGSILQRFLIVSAWALACALVPMNALGQHPAGHPGASGRAGGGVRMSVPPPAPIPAAQAAGAPHGPGPHAGAHLGVGPRGLHVGPPRIPIFRPRVFFGRPVLRLGAGLGYNSLWWPTCGPALSWAWGGAFDCSPSPYYGLAFQNYAAPLTYETAEYFYGGSDRDVVWLYLKDGKVFGATDYWFVSGQMHFRMVEDDPTRTAEHVIAQDELDVEKTIYVNSHRGFRLVYRDEPWEKFLKDHPDVTPPDLTAAQQKQ